MKKTDKVSNASVKIMRSHDYCHFEVNLGVDEPITIAQIDEIRKEANRLVDKAVLQYKVAREDEENRITYGFNIEVLRQEVQAIKENFPKVEWTPEQKAKVKVLEDREYRLSRQYDYEDDWDGEEDWDDEEDW